MKLYGKFFLMHLKSVMEYKASFFMTVIGQFIISFTSFLGLYFLFMRFENVNGFSFQEVLLCYAAVLVSYSVAECFAYGFKSFASTIANGQFDRIMIRPCSELFLVMVSEFEFTAVGKLVQALLVLVYAVQSQKQIWRWDTILVYLGMMVGGTFLFMGLYIIYAALCFYTTEGLEFMNIFTDGGKEFGKYPMSIYGNTILKVFTFLVPLACVQNYPLLYVLGRTDSVGMAVLPVCGFLFFVVSCRIWKIGVRNYKSTGS